MLDVNWIINNKEKFEEAMKSRGADCDLKEIEFLEKSKKIAQKSIDDINRDIKANSKSKKISIETKKNTGQSLKESKAENMLLLKEYKKLLLDELLNIPNIPHKDCPVGGEEANKVIREWEPEDYKEPSVEKPRDHISICKELGLVDFERGVKLSGSGFPLFIGKGAKLVRQLIDLFLDEAENNGYIEIHPPLLVNEKTMTGTGQLPKFKEDMYRCNEDDLYLIPTAEVPVTNMYADEILSGKVLPIAHCAYTPCFRREAGSYGADSKGLMRLHQFDKVELVRFCKPDDSEKEHELILSHAENLLKGLGLKYRVLELATKDLGFSAHRCYDLEVWAPVAKKWLEVSSVSNFKDFQARRANIRFRGDKKKPEFVHTLNGSGLALPRIIIALLETHQRMPK